MRKALVSAVVIAGFVIPWRLASRPKVQNPIRRLAIEMAIVTLVWGYLVVRFYWRLPE